MDPVIPGSPASLLSSSPAVTLIGRSALDHYCTHVSTTFSIDHVRFEFRDSPIIVKTHKPPVPGGKVVADIPPDFLNLNSRIVVGGSVVNTAAAFRRVSNSRARLVDMSIPAESVRREVRYIGMDAVFLELYPCACNIVCGKDGDKTILKSPPVAVTNLNPEQAAQIEAACQSPITAINSLADPVVAERIVSETAKGRTALFAMLTPSLPSAIAMKAVLPAARAIFVSLDDLPQTLGWQGCELTVSGALKAAGEIGRLAQNADVYVTMGRKGVAVAKRGGETAHIYLDPAKAASVQALADKDPTRTNGCGDAFYGGAIAWCVAGDSLVPGLKECGLETEICAGIAACTSAIRWMGCSDALNPADFRVERGRRW